MMYKVKEAIIVEGRYDVIKLTGFLDTVIIKTDGFRIYNDKNTLKTIKTLAKTTGIVLLTDSDTAGFRIRSFIGQYVTEGDVKNAFIPEIKGKEKRKQSASKEGLLGVEGVLEETILTALKNAGCEIDGKAIKTNITPITKTDLYVLGLLGKENSADLRRKLCQRLNIPSRLSSNMLVNVLNKLVGYDELKNLCDEIKV